MFGTQILKVDLGSTQPVRNEFLLYYFWEKKKWDCVLTGIVVNSAYLARS